MREFLHWETRLTPMNTNPWLHAGFVLDGEGAFYSCERRSESREYGEIQRELRAGYVPVLGQSFRAAPYERAAILWHKLWLVRADAANMRIELHGNRRDKITLYCAPQSYTAVLAMIQRMRLLHPIRVQVDVVAAKWLMWRDDEVWQGIGTSLLHSLALERGRARVVPEQYMEETRIFRV